MKAKSRINIKRNYKRKREVKSLLILTCLVIAIITVVAKGNHREVVGYVYDTGNTIWEMAERHCPNDMDIRDFMSEIRNANEIEDYVVYKDCAYKIPVYEK